MHEHVHDNANVNVNVNIGEHVKSSIDRSSAKEKQKRHGFHGFSRIEFGFKSVESVAFLAVALRSHLICIFEPVDLDVHVHRNVGVVVDGFCLITSWNKFTVGAQAICVDRKSPR